MFQGNEEQVVSQKLREGLDNLHVVSQVTLGLASWTWIGLQGLSQLTIGSRLALVCNKNSPKPHETVGANPTSTPNFKMSLGVLVVTQVFDTWRICSSQIGTTKQDFIASVA